MEVKEGIAWRAWLAVMAGFWGFSLPVSGLVLHLYSHQPALAGRHAWFTVHVVAGACFLIFALGHAVANRRMLGRHLRVVLQALGR